MPSTPIAGNSHNFHSEPPDRQVGALGVTEEWWRDRYDEIAERGYQLRPRYKPNWQPSWLESGKNFYSAEDGQPSKVRVATIIYLLPPPLTSVIVKGSNGRDPRAG